MKNYDEKEAKVLNNIADTLVKLDGTLDRLEDSTGKVKHFAEQELAIHEIKSIIRNCHKLEELEDDRVKDNVLDMSILEDLKDENLKTVAKTIGKLDETVKKLDENKDSKVKSYILQKKALHETKKILHDAGLYASYTENELEDLDNLM